MLGLYGYFCVEGDAHILPTYKTYKLTKKFKHKYIFLIMIKNATTRI